MGRLAIPARKQRKPAFWSARDWLSLDRRRALPAPIGGGRHRERGGDRHRDQIVWRSGRQLALLTDATFSSPPFCRRARIDNAIVLQSYEQVVILHTPVVTFCMRCLLIAVCIRVYGIATKRGASGRPRVSACA